MLIICFLPDVKASSIVSYNKMYQAGQDTIVVSDGIHDESIFFPTVLSPDNTSY